MKYIVFYTTRSRHDDILSAGTQMFDPSYPCEIHGDEFCPSAVHRIELITRNVNELRAKQLDVLGHTVSDKMLEAFERELDSEGGSDTNER